MLLKKLRTALTQQLWHTYKKDCTQADILERALIQRSELPVLDHFAIIDLPSPHSGIPTLAEIFLGLGYCHRGQGYLPEKQNDFIWLCETDAHNHKAHDVLPQVVLADFRLHELPKHIQSIIEKYTQHIDTSNLILIKELLIKTQKNDALAAEKLLQVLPVYLNQREWPLPSRAEVLSVAEVNELLAWVLLFGRKPNHFTISAHLLNTFDTFESFLSLLSHELHLPLNTTGGLIKGNAQLGIQQSSTQGPKIITPVADGTLEMSDCFIEFVWRYRHTDKGHAWQNYFTGFIAHNANHVIESLYQEHV